MIFSDNYYPGTEKWMKSYYYNHRKELKSNDLNTWGNVTFYQCRKSLKSSPKTRCTNMTIDKENQYCIEHY
jgi:hypothetical protein